MSRPAVEIRAPRPGDVEFVAQHMRAADAAEVRAGGREPLEALQRSVAVSALTWTAEVNGRPAAVFGVAPLGSALDPRGAPWLLGTDDVPRSRRALAALTPRYIAEMLGMFPHLINCVHSRNAVAVTWLTRSGFVLGDTFDHPVTGEPFTTFEMRAGGTQNL